MVINVLRTLNVLSLLMFNRKFIQKVTRVINVIKAIGCMSCLIEVIRVTDAKATLELLISWGLYVFL